MASIAAARLYAHAHPDLALACACRALECGSEPRYAVNVHRELGQLLAERDESAQASREVAITVEIRQEQGWNIDPKLQALIDSSWYDPASVDAEEPRAFYARYAPEALILCFDHVDQNPATYLGTIWLRPGADASDAVAGGPFGNEFDRHQAYRRDIASRSTAGGGRTR